MGDGSTEHCDALKNNSRQNGQDWKRFCPFFSKAGNSIDYILALIETILYLVTYFALNLDGVVESPIYCALYMVRLRRTT